MTSEEVVPMDKLARVYIKIRSQLAALTQEFEQAEARLKAQQDQIAAAMRDQMLTMKSTSLKTDAGTIILSKRTKYWASDWEEFYNFMMENNAPQLLEKRIAQKNMAEFLAANPDARPASLNSETSYEISVRKPT